MSEHTKHFEVSLTPRFDSVTVTVDAEDRDAAASAAMLQHPNLVLDSAVEFDADGEVVAESTYLATCEGCGRRIWEGEQYAADADGCYECLTCLEQSR